MQDESLGLRTAGWSRHGSDSTGELLGGDLCALPGALPWNGRRLGGRGRWRHGSVLGR
jgi:hypothetical protein